MSFDASSIDLIAHKIRHEAHDPLTAHPHSPDISTFRKVCDIHYVPLTTHLAVTQIVPERDHLKEIRRNQKRPAEFTSPSGV